MLLHGIKYNFLTAEIFEKFFANIVDFRTAFDLPIDVGFTTESLNLHFDLYREEMRELFSAETRVDKIDAIVDSLYVLFSPTIP